jgi:hypothetical protein
MKCMNVPARQSELDRNWRDLMSLCTKEREYKTESLHPKLLRLITRQVDELAAQMGFSQQQIRSREFRAEKDGEHISRLLIE